MDITTEDSFPFEYDYQIGDAKVQIKEHDWDSVTVPVSKKIEINITKPPGLEDESFEANARSIAEGASKLPLQDRLRSEHAGHGHDLGDRYVIMPDLNQDPHLGSHRFGLERRWVGAITDPKSWVDSFNTKGQVLFRITATNEDTHSPAAQVIVSVNNCYKDTSANEESVAQPSEASVHM